MPKSRKMPKAPRAQPDNLKRPLIVRAIIAAAGICVVVLEALARVMGWADGIITLWGYLQ